MLQAETSRPVLCSESDWSWSPWVLLALTSMKLKSRPFKANVRKYFVMPYTATPWSSLLPPVSEATNSGQLEKGFQCCTGDGMAS